VTTQECETLLVGLSASIHQAEGLVAASREVAHAAESTASKARDTAEHARATAEMNEKLFRLFMSGARTQAARCEDHRKRLDAIEAQLKQIGER
jgi:hypothetical protein